MKKGFASMTIVYSFLIVFILVLLALLALYTQKSRLVDSIVSEGKAQLENTNPITIFNYDDEKSYYEWEVPYNGYYLVELWGAQGGGENGGKGGYTSGRIHLLEGETFYVYVGGTTDTYDGGFNGGGTTKGGTATGGGGSTDIRYFGNAAPTAEQLEWDSNLGLNSRIMVAAGGGGQGTSGSGGFGGGIKGAKGKQGTADKGGEGGEQTTGGSCFDIAWCKVGAFGKGGSGSEVWGDNGGAGGGGYYGGGSSTGGDHYGGGGGGSSFISGYTGCVAIASGTDTSEPRVARTGTGGSGCVTGTTDNLCSIHYSGKAFTGKIVSEVRKGNGFAKITYIGGNI